ncbi:MAG TPA: GYF domain-containing protein, partial [Polyangiaceae bacterium]|nr:GYF domain-containing protein [Polyangiaceae bacterium]
MDAPLGEQEWMVQITPLDRRMMSTEQLLNEIATGTLVKRDMLVWRTGMSDWAPINRIEELAGSGVMDVPVLDRRPLPAPLPPPPAPIPPRVGAIGSSTLASPGALPPPPALAPPPSLASTRVPAPSTPFGAPRPLTPVPDVPPPAPLPLLNSAFSPPIATPPEPPSGMPELGSAFNVPPPAAAPQPPPVPASMRTNTQRPVAVDFSEIEPSRAAPARILIGSGVAALAMIVGTVYALSAGGVFDSSPAASHVQAEPAAASSAPSTAKATEAKSVEAKPAEPKAEAAAAEPSRAEPQTQPVSAKEEIVAAPGTPRDVSKADMPKADAPKADAPKADEKEEEATAKSDDDESDDREEATPSKSRAERRLARRQKRAAAAEERAAAPRRTKARAAAAPAPAAPAEAEEPSAPKATTTDPPGSTFNRQAAKTALDDAAAQARNCRPQGGPSGSGRVQVRYEPNGKVGAVSILTPQFDNTTTGSCIVMVFRRASIPAFTGSPPVVMNKNFEIP